MPITHSWSLDTVGCGAGVLNSASTATPDFTPAQFGSCVVSLVVTDANGLTSSADTVTVTAVATAITDTTASGAALDGTVGAGEYGGSTQGINGSFGNVIGSSSKLHMESTSTGTVQFALESGGGALNDVVVLYIDSVSGGYAGTGTFTETGDPFREAISATNGTFRNDLVFPSGFSADYAIAVSKDFAMLFQLNASNHVFVASLSLLPTDSASAGAWEFSFNLADIGLTAGDSFRYFATCLSPSTAYRSDEFHGVAASTVASGTIAPGTTTTLGAHDFIVFTSYRQCN